jgi:hypothetical protein
MPMNMRRRQTIRRIILRIFLPCCLLICPREFNRFFLGVVATDICWYWILILMYLIFLQVLSDLFPNEWTNFRADNRYFPTYIDSSEFFACLHW